MIVITIANQKGGVGKTTTAVTLAHGLAAKGKPTLLIDLDPQGQCSTALGLVQEPMVFQWLVSERPLLEVVRPADSVDHRRRDLSLIPGDKATAKAQILMAIDSAPVTALADRLKRLARTNLRYIVIDTAPTLGGLQERALYAADLVIVPSATTFLSADAVSRTIATMQANQAAGWRGRLIGILPTFHDDRAREPGQVLRDLHVIYPGQVLEPVHQATALQQATAEGCTIWEYDGRSRAAEEYARLLYLVMEAG